LQNLASEISIDPGMNALKVLVVDDNAAMRGIVRAVLTGFGCAKIKEAADAKSGFEILAKHPVDLLIVDWKMTPVDGLALVKRIRNPEKSPNPYLPIIMLSAYSDAEKVRIARDAGVTEFLVKPFNSAALYARLATIVNRPRPFVRTKEFFGPDRRRPEKTHEGAERREEAPIA
jgi:two-component system chemotaxis response regulator CheY